MSVAVHALSFTIGFFFVFVGVMKVTPQVNNDTYEDLRKEFGRFNKVFPFYKQTGWRPLAKDYRMTVGIAEIVCGAMLILLPGFLKQVANFVLLFMMLGAVYTHMALGDGLEKMTPSLVFSLLLVCRLIVVRQVEAREASEYVARQDERRRQAAEKSEEEKKDD